MDKQWYYVVNDKDKAGPISELELKNLIQQGQVAPTSLVWCEGMANWQAANQVPGLIGMGPAPAAAPAASPAAGLSSAASAPQSTAPTGSYASSYGAASGGAVPEGLVGWTKFIGVLSIIHGILTCLGCITIPLGVLMIIAGNAALNSCKSLDGMGSVDGMTLAYLQNIKKFMLMWGIVAIVGIILTLISIPVYISMVSQMMEQMQSSGAL